MQITPVFPEPRHQRGDARTERTGTAWVSTVRVECSEGLAGQTIGTEGLEAFATDVRLRVQHTGGSVETHVLEPIEPSVTLRRAGDTQRGVWAYLNLGIEHILLGIDHLLFVLGLLLIVRERWMLVKTGTAFTIAHSITLAVATFGVAQVAAAPLNATIAGFAVVAGLTHGYVNGASLVPGGASSLGLAGVVTAVFCVFAILSARVTTLRAGSARNAVRVAGSWIAAAGVLMLGWLARSAGG